MILYPNQKTLFYPNWLGNEEFHASHRSNLLTKDFAFYSRYKWTEKLGMPYIWPINN